MDGLLMCSSISVQVYDARMEELQGMRRVPCPYCGKERYYDVRSALSRGLTQVKGGCHKHGGGCGDFFSFKIPAIG